MLTTFCGFVYDLLGIPRSNSLPLKRKNSDTPSFIPYKYARSDSVPNLDPEVSGLNHRTFYSASRKPMQSRENCKQPQEDDCSIIAEISRKKGSSNTSKHADKPFLSGLPPTRFAQKLAERGLSCNILDEKPASCKKRTEDDIEVLNCDYKSSKSSKDSSNYKIFKTKRNDNLSASKNVKNRRGFELDLKKKIRNRFQDSFRLQERLQYGKLLAMEMGTKRFSLPSTKTVEKPVLRKSTIPVIDLTDDKSLVRINRSHESIPQTSSGKSSENDIQIVEEIPKVRSLKDMLKFNPINAEEVVEEFLARHPKLPPSSQELALLDEDSEDDKPKGSEVSKKESACDALEEQLRNYMRITAPTADEEPCCCVIDFTDKQLKKIGSALIAHPAGQVLVEQFGLSLTRRDIQTLKGLNWLNDEVINFYMHLIMERSKQKSSFPKVYAFNTFFYPKLMNGGHSGLKRWTKKVDVFSYDIILVPVHLGMHWCMAVVDFRRKEVRYYDSMGSPNDRCLKALLYYLEAESSDKKNKKYDTSSWDQINVDDIPQQMNGSDCGVFSCMFAEHLARDARIDFTQENMPYFRRKMVLEIMQSKLLTS